MKKLKKKLTLILTVGIMAMMFVGCGKKEVDPGVNYQFKVESEKGFDSIKLKIKDMEVEMTPSHENKKIILGDSNQMQLDEVNDIPFSVEVIDEGKTLLSKEVKLDFSNGKVARIKLVDTKDGGIDLEVQN